MALAVRARYACFTLMEYSISSGSLLGLFVFLHSSMRAASACLAATICCGPPVMSTCNPSTKNRVKGEQRSEKPGHKKQGLSKVPVSKRREYRGEGGYETTTTPSSKPTAYARAGPLNKKPKRSSIRATFLPRQQNQHATRIGSYTIGRYKKK